MPFLKSGLLPVLLSMGLMIGGCAHDPFVTSHELNVSNDIAPPDRVTEASIGIYYEKSSANYIHITARERSIFARDVGRKGVNLLSSTIPKVFSKAELLGELAPYDVPAVNMDGIVEPRLNMAFDQDGKSIQIGYTFIFYTEKGVPISAWFISGERKRFEDQLVDVAQKFANEFHSSPQTAIFRKYLKDKRVGKFGFDVDDVEVTARVLEKNEQGLNFKELGILPVQVTVTNNAGSDVTGRGFDARLIYSNGKRLVASFPLAVVSAIQYHAALGATDSALVAGFFGGLAGMGAFFGEASEQSKERREQARFFEDTRLKETTLSSGESIQRTLYFVLPEEVTELNEATFSLWLLDRATGGGARKTIGLPGINYEMSEVTKLAYTEIANIYPPAFIKPIRITGDFSGTYASEITYTEIPDMSYPRSFFGLRPNIRIKMEQTGSSIKGVFHGDRSGELEGTVEGNKIVVDFFIMGPRGVANGSGILVFNDATGAITGNWKGHSSFLAGEWILIKTD